MQCIIFPLSGYIPSCKAYTHINHKSIKSILSALQGSVMRSTLSEYNFPCKPIQTPYRQKQAGYRRLYRDMIRKAWITPRYACTLRPIDQAISTTSALYSPASVRTVCACICAHIRQSAIAGVFRRVCASE